MCKREQDASMNGCRALKCGLHRAAGSLNVNDIKSCAPSAMSIYKQSSVTMYTCVTVFKLKLQLH